MSTFAQKHLLEFIEIYEQETCLWQVKSKEYSNRNLKQISYEKLVAKWKEVEPTATKDVVVKKINSLRTCFRKELKKVNASFKSGSGTDDVYSPSLWYYNSLLFLRDLETPRDSYSNLNLDSLLDERLEEEPEADTQDNSNGFNEEFADECEQNEEPRPTSSLTSKKTPDTSQKRKGKPQQDDLMALAVAKLSKSTDEDEFDCVGKNIAAKLRRLPVEQRVIAEKLLNYVIYEAQLCNLNKNSVVIADPQWG